jgi:type I restriction enzyme M protein
MDQDIRRKLDRITDTLWAGGVTNPVTYIEQISYLIYLKLLDEEEIQRELQEQLGVTNAGSKRLYPTQGRALPLVKVAVYEWAQAAGLSAGPKYFPIWLPW